LKLISFINFPVALLLILFPKQFVSVMWGSQWMMVTDLLPYFGLLILTQTLFSTIGSILVIERKEKALMYSGLVGAVCVILGIIYGIFISLTAVAAFYALSYIVLVLPFTLFYIMKRVLRFKEPVRLLLPQLILSLLIWLCLYFQQDELLVASLILWLINIIVNSLPELKKLFLLRKTFVSFNARH
jgi:O-antigen/teichoic acid export membrane protein